MDGFAENFKMKANKSIPFDFIVDALYGLNPVTKPMFGTTAVYVYGKIVLALRDNKKDPQTNDVWVAVDQLYHPELIQLIPSLTTFEIFGTKTRNWLLLPSTAEDFEKEANLICELIKRNDKRIGRHKN